MTTATLHSNVQRSRFVQHALSAFSAIFPFLLRRADEPRAGDAAQEAAAVRELAQRYVKTDPGFADDLYAAANRHEAAGSQ